MKHKLLEALRKLEEIDLYLAEHHSELYQEHKIEDSMLDIFEAIDEELGKIAEEEPEKFNMAEFANDLMLLQTIHKQ